MKNTLLASAAAALILGAGTIAAHATPTPNIVGSYTVSYASTAGSSASISYDFGRHIRYSSPKAYSIDLALAIGDSTNASDFFGATPESCYRSSCKISTGTVTVNFTFTGPDAGSASATGTYEANYNNTTDSITWDGASANGPDGRNGKPTSFGSLIIPVTFADDTELDITLYNAADWTVTPKISFSYKDASPTSVPEPGSLALLGTALLGLGFVIARRRRVTT